MTLYEEYEYIADFLIEKIGNQFDVNVLCSLENDIRTNIHVNIYEKNTANLLYKITIDDDVYKAFHYSGLNRYAYAMTTVSRKRFV